MSDGEPISRSATAEATRTVEHISRQDTGYLAYQWLVKRASNAEIQLDNLGQNFPQYVSADTAGKQDFLYRLARIFPEDNSTSSDLLAQLQHLPEFIALDNTTQRRIIADTQAHHNTYRQHAVALNDYEDLAGYVLLTIGDHTSNELLAVIAEEPFDATRYEEVKNRLLADAEARERVFEINTRNGNILDGPLAEKVQKILLDNTGDAALAALGELSTNEQENLQQAAMNTVAGVASIGLRNGENVEEGNVPQWENAINHATLEAVQRVVKLSLQRRSEVQIEVGGTSEASLSPEIFTTSVQDFFQQQSVVEEAQGESNSSEEIIKTLQKDPNRILQDIEAMVHRRGNVIRLDSVGELQQLLFTLNRIAKPEVLLAVPQVGEAQRRIEAYLTPVYEQAFAKYLGYSTREEIPQALQGVFSELVEGIKILYFSSGNESFLRKHMVDALPETQLQELLTHVGEEIRKNRISDLTAESPLSAQEKLHRAYTRLQIETFQRWKKRFAKSDFDKMFRRYVRGAKHFLYMQSDRSCLYLSGIPIDGKIEATDWNASTNSSVEFLLHTVSQEQQGVKVKEIGQMEGLERHLTPSGDFAEMKALPQALAANLFLWVPPSSFSRENTDFQHQLDWLEQSLNGAQISENRWFKSTSYVKLSHALTLTKASDLSLAIREIIGPDYRNSQPLDQPKSLLYPEMSVRILSNVKNPRVGQDPLLIILPASIRTRELVASLQQRRNPRFIRFVTEGENLTHALEEFYLNQAQNKLSQDVSAQSTAVSDLIGRKVAYNVEVEDGERTINSKVETDQSSVGFTSPERGMIVLCSGEGSDKAAEQLFVDTHYQIATVSQVNYAFRNFQDVLPVQLETKRDIWPFPEWHPYEQGNKNESAIRMDIPTPSTTMVKLVRNNQTNTQLAVIHQDNVSGNVYLLKADGTLVLLSRPAYIENAVKRGEITQGQADELTLFVTNNTPKNVDRALLQIADAQITAKITRLQRRIDPLKRTYYHAKEKGKFLQVHTIAKHLYRLNAKIQKLFRERTVVQDAIGSYSAFFTEGLMRSALKGIADENLLDVVRSKSNVSELYYSIPEEAADKIIEIAEGVLKERLSGQRNLLEKRKVRKRLKALQERQKMDNPTDWGELEGLKREKREKKMHERILNHIPPYMRNVGQQVVQYTRSAGDEVYRGHHEIVQQVERGDIIFATTGGVPASAIRAATSTRQGNLQAIVDKVSQIAASTSDVGIKARVVALEVA